MFMKTPVPFGHDASGMPLQSAPYGSQKLVLDPLGLDVKFPCQFGPDFQYPTSDAPKVAAGSSTLLTFQGSAVHGGGSCQISLAKTPSVDPKDWHVIHSIIGGCPGITAPGEGEHGAIGAAGTVGGQDNFINSTPNNPDAPQCADIDTDDIQCLKKYNIPIPKEVASGTYFLAWTWFNKIGNREMYMNCAPLEVTGGGSSDDWLNKQPSIFYANDDGKPCMTAQEFSLDFPQPGDSVLRSNDPFDNIEVSHQGIGAQCAALYPPQSSTPAHLAFPKPAAGGNGTLPASSTGSLSIATSIVGTTSVTAIAPITSVPVSAAPTSSATRPGVFAPGASSASAAPVASGYPSTPAAGCAHPCTEDGKLVCLPPNQWGICDHGCVVPQAVAAGMVCQNGGMIPGSAGKRNVKDVSRVMKSRRASLRKSKWTA